MSNFEIVWRDDTELLVRDGEHIRRFSYVRRGSDLLLTDGHSYWTFTVGAATSRQMTGGTDAAATGVVASGRILSQMPGKVIDVRVRPGDTVGKGDVLLVLEAMKMEHAIVAPLPGTVAHLTLTVSERVMPGDLLAEIEPLP